MHDQHPLSSLDRWKYRVKQLKTEPYALYLAYCDPRTPWYARLFAILIVAHTLSPIDLIPDFIPVLGYVDDLVITPLVLWLALRMIPAQVIHEARLQAAESQEKIEALGKVGLAMTLGVWVGVILLISWLIWRAARGV
ncbi:MAG: YkvA family protein [Anaerolineales bacterium]|nr:YkvA family protein [Anaerolineales bacterium]